MPAPSPITKPSRSRSKGREARTGSSLRVDSARMAAKPPTPSGVMAASLPPAIMASASPALDEPERVPHRMRARRAGRARRRVGTLRTGPDRDPARRQVDDGGGDEERADLARSVLEQRLVLALDCRESADPAADVDPGLLRVRGVDDEPGILERHVSGRHGELDEPVHLLDVLLLHPLQRIETLDLGREAGRVLRRVEERDRPRAGAAGEEGFPRRPGVVTEGRDDPNPRHDDSALLVHFLGGHLARGDARGRGRQRATSWLSPRASRCIRRLP